MIVKNDVFFQDVKAIIDTQDVIFKVKGTSMWPFFKDGKTTITLTKPKQLKRLGIYLFEIDNKFFLHRLIKIKKENYIFQGDGLISKEIVKKDQIVGFVSAYQTKKQIYTHHKRYKLRVFLYRLLPRRIIIKVFK